MRHAWVVFRKELRETLRDRRTLLIMIVVPVLLYPLLFIALEQLMLFGERRVGARPAVVAVQGQPLSGLGEFLERTDALTVLEGEFDVADIRDGRVEAVAVAHGDAGPDGTASIQLLYDEASERSQRARTLLEDAILAWGDSLLARRLVEAGLPPEFVRPVIVADSSVALPQERSGYMLGRFLPLLLVVITLLGAFYPAIDLAAGEKERGTLETLLTAPAPPAGVLAGKFLTVALIALLAASLNLGSMLLTLRAGLFEAVEELDLAVVLPAHAVVLIFAALVPLAVLFAGIFLGLAVRAHSFKEAQNALTPVYMFVLVPAMLPVVPGIELSPALALVPVAGVALLFRAAMEGDVATLPAVLALVSSAGYALAALVFAARAFGREDILFGSGETAESGDERPWRAFLQRLRARDGRVPTPGQALFFVVAVAVLFFYLGRPLQLRFGPTAPLQALFASQWLLLFLPAVLFVVLGGFDVRRTFALRRPSPRALAATLLLAAGGVPIAMFLAWLQSRLLPVPEEFLRAMEQLVLAEDPRELPWLLIVVALTPAICEETVFRGLLLSGTARALRARDAIVLNALVFGGFHLSFETAIRFLPTAWLGLLLALVVWRTRSIFAGMLMHLLNNGSVVLLAAWPAGSAWIGIHTGQPRLVLLPFALAALAAGLRLLYSDPARERPA